MYLYLDVDGVLNPFPKMGKMGDWPDFENLRVATPELFGIEYLYLRLSEKMGESLLDLGIDIVWNTTWCDIQTGLKEIASYLGLDHCRPLLFEEYDPTGVAKWRHYRDQKLYRMLDDVATHQTPFIWCDDEAIDIKSRQHLKSIESLPPYLLVSPESKTGLTSNEIESMRRFIRSQS